MGSAGQKSFTAPAWIIMSIGLFQALFDFLAFRITGVGFDDSVQRSLLSWVLLIWVMPFFVEAFVYWLLRKRIMKKNLAWMHILLTLLALISWRLLLMVPEPLEHPHVIMYLILPCLFAGQAFFIALVILSLIKKTPPAANDEPIE